MFNFDGAVEAQKLSNEKVRDPVHGYIHIQDQIILDLINTREFNACAELSNWAVPSTPSTGPNIRASVTP